MNLPLPFLGQAELRLDPLAPAWALWLLCAVLGASLALYAWRRGRAVWLRGAGAGLLLLGLAGPTIVREVREEAPDVVTLIVDRSASLELAGRSAAVEALAERISSTLQGDPGLEVRVREVRDDENGTPLTAAVRAGLADMPPGRIAGAILITDGQASDPPEDPERFKDAGPIQVLLVGSPDRVDRRLQLLSAPGFGIVGEALTVRAQVDDTAASGLVEVTLAVNGEVARRVQVEPNRPFEVRTTLTGRGANVVTLEAAAGNREISLANNRAAFEVTGVRDRLRVLLITGEPYPGARTWRNFLKSDPAVDLVHFTILRPIEKTDPETLPSELSLIQFPHRELFEEKLREFDLVIFDRYRRRGILEYSYFENLAQHVETGGALLVVAGPYDAGLDSLARTPLAAILPAKPTYALHDAPYRPAPTLVGQRHPVLRGLPDPGRWGRWDRLVGATAAGGQTILAADGRPLLVLDRVGKGRVAQLWSDQMWFWARGHDGGGPHAELLRRLGHWLMGEPELDEERLTLAREGDGLRIERSTLAATAPPVELEAPDGARQTLRLEPAGPGLWRAHAPAAAPGLYQARSADALHAFAAIGGLDSKEAAALQAVDGPLRPMATASGGGVWFTGEDGAAAPVLRRVEGDGKAAGPDWAGLRRNHAYTVQSSQAQPLGPGLAWAALGLGLLMLAWLREGR